jgi:hypothetical protein
MEPRRVSAVEARAYPRVSKADLPDFASVVLYDGERASVVMYYVVATSAAHAATGMRTDMAKYFRREDAERHAAEQLSVRSSFYDVRIEEREDVL